MEFPYFPNNSGKAGPVLQSKGMREIFQKKGEKGAKKGKIFENVGKKG